MKISSSWFLATRSDSSEIQSEDAVGKHCQREKHFSSTHCFLKSVSIKLVSLPYINFYWLCAVATSVHNPWTCNLTTTITGHSLLFPISHFLLFPWHCLLPRYHGSHPQIISPPNISVSSSLCFCPFIAQLPEGWEFQRTVQRPIPIKSQQQLRIPLLHFVLSQTKRHLRSAGEMCAAPVSSPAFWWAFSSQDCTKPAQLHLQDKLKSAETCLRLDQLCNAF